MRNTRVLLASLGGLTLAALMVGCVPSGPSEKPSAPVSQEAPDDEETAASEGGDVAWAKPVTTPGDKIATITGDGFEVAVYQVGTATAQKTGQFVTPEGEPVIATGDEIVFVNYVVTNTSGADIPLSFNLVGIDARYADWPYLQGMDSIVDSALFEKMQVNSSAFALGATEAPFVWPAGSSFSYGQNFLYEKGGAITFSATLTPADENGDLVHDKRQEVKVDATIS